MNPPQSLTEVVWSLRQGLGEDLVAVVLFGSRARGEADPESDWDLLVVARNLPEKLLQRHFRIKILLPDAWRGRVAALVKTPEEFEARLPALYLDIALDGVVLHDTPTDTSREGSRTCRVCWSSAGCGGRGPDVSRPGAGGSRPIQRGPWNGGAAYDRGARRGLSSEGGAGIPGRSAPGRGVGSLAFGGGQ